MADMRGILVFALLVCFTQAEPGWKANYTYTYNVNSRSLITLNQLENEYQGVVVKAILQLKTGLSPSELSGQLTDLQYADVQTVLPNSYLSPIDESSLQWKNIATSNITFGMMLDEGLVTKLYVKKNSSTWEANFIRAVVSQLQIDIHGKNKIASKTFSKYYQTDESNILFYSMEKSVTGHCEVLYHISPLPENLLQYKPELAPLLNSTHEHDSIFDIVKISNFSNCKQPIVFHRGMSGRNNWGADNLITGDLITREAEARIIANGTFDKYTVQSSVIVNKMLIAPYLYKNSKSLIISSMNLTLKDIRKLASPPSLFNEFLTTLLYDYEYNSGENDELDEGDVSSFNDTKEVDDTEKQSRNVRHILEHGKIYSSPHHRRPRDTELVSTEASTTDISDSTVDESSPILLDSTTASPDDNFISSTAVSEGSSTVGDDSISRPTDINALDLDIITTEFSTYDKDLSENAATAYYNNTHANNFNGDFGDSDSDISTVLKYLNMSKGLEQPVLTSFFSIYPTVKNTSTLRSEEIQNAIRIISGQIGSKLLKFDTLLEEDALSKYYQLTSLITNVGFEILLNVTKTMYVSPQSKDIKGRSAWIVFRDAVAQAGTGPALMAIKEWIICNKTTSDEGAELIGVLASTVQIPNEQYIDALFEMIKDPRIQLEEHFNVSALLTFTNIVHNVLVDTQAGKGHYPVYIYHPLFQNTNKLKTVYFPYLENGLEDAIANKDSHKIHVYIRALGNIAHVEILNIFRQYIRKTRDITTFQKLLMIMCLDKTAKLYPAETRNFLYTIYVDEKEEYELRAAAASQIINTNPPVHVLRKMADFTNFEPSNQVIAAVKSSIQSAAQLHTDENTELKQNAKSVLHLLNPKDFGLQYSHQLLKSDILSPFDNLKYSGNINYIGSYNDILPKGLFVNYERYLGGLTSGKEYHGILISDMKKIRYLLSNLWTATGGSETNTNENKEPDEYPVCDVKKRDADIKKRDIDNKQNNSSKDGEGNGNSDDRAVILDKELLDKQNSSNVNENNNGGDYGLLLEEQLNEQNNSKDAGGKQTPKVLEELEGLLMYHSAKAEKFITFGQNLHSSISKCIQQKLETLRRGYKFNYTKFFNKDMFILAVPDVAGHIIQVTYNVPSVHLMEGKMKLNIKQGTEPSPNLRTAPQKLSLSGRFNIGHAFNKHTEIGIVTPFNGNRYATGYKQQILINIPLQVNASAIWKQQWTNVNVSFSPYSNSSLGFYSQYKSQLYRQNSHISDIVKERNTIHEKTIQNQSPRKIGKIYGGLQLNITFPRTNKYYSDFWNTHPDISTFLKFPLAQKSMENINIILTALFPTAHSSITFRTQYANLKMNSSTQKTSEHKSSEKKHKFNSQAIKDFADSNTVLANWTVLLNQSKKPLYVVDLNYTWNDFHNTTNFNLSLSQETAGKQCKLCNLVTLLVDGTWAKVHIFNLSRALITSPHSVLKVGLQFGYLKSHIATMECNLLRTSQRKDYLLNQTQTKECLKEMQNNNLFLSSCQEAIRNANYIDQHKCTIQTKVLSENYKTVQQALTLMQPLMYGNFESHHRKYPSSANHIYFITQFSPSFQTADISILLPNKNVQMKNISINSLLQPFVKILPSYSVMARIGHFVVEHEYNPTCVIDSNKVSTFDQKTYTISLGSCWHVLTSLPLDNTAKPSLEENILILARDSDEGRVVRIMVGENVIHLTTQPSNKHSTHKYIHVDDSQYHLFYGKFTNIALSSQEKSIQLQGSLIEEKIKLDFIDHSIQILYDGTRVMITVGNIYRNQTHGLCGTLTGEQSDDFQLPTHCNIQKPHLFSASYAIVNNDTCSGSALEWANKSINMSCSATTDIYVDESFPEIKPCSNNTDRESDPKCFSSYVQVKQDYKRTCFSQDRIPKCKDSCYPVDIEQKNVKFHCVSTSVVSKHFVGALRTGKSLDFSKKQTTKLISLDVPTGCYKC